MKKLFIILLLFLSGCNGETAINDIDPSQNIIEDFVSPLKTVEWNCNLPLSSFKEIRGNTAITINGEVYTFSFDQLYSNNQNCKKVDTDLVFTRFLYFWLITDENEIYSFVSPDDFQLIDSEKTAFSTGFNNGFYDNFNDIFYIHLQFNVYKDSTDYYGQLANNGSTIIIFDSSGEEFRRIVLEDETVLEFSNSTIKTSKGYYTFKMYKEFADSEYEVRLIKLEIPQEVIDASTVLLLDSGYSFNYYFYLILKDKPKFLYYGYNY